MKPGATRKLRYLPQTRLMLEGYGQRLKIAANSTLNDEHGDDGGYQMSSRRGARHPWGRWRVTVMAVGSYARRSDRKHNTLIKKLGQL